MVPYSKPIKKELYGETTKTKVVHLNDVLIALIKRELYGESNLISKWCSNPN